MAAWRGERLAQPGSVPPRPYAPLRADPGLQASPARSGTCREDEGKSVPGLMRSNDRFA
jgi:hypothetical protein